MSNTIAETNTHLNTIDTANQANHADAHAEHQAAPGDRSQVFGELLKGLGDHDGFIVGPYKVAETPIILIDDGFHFFTSKSQLVNSGKYLIENHHGHDKILRTSDHQSPALDLSVTNLVVFQWIAMLIVGFIFFLASRKYKKNPMKAPSGIQNLVEKGVQFIRDEIVSPNIESKKTVNRMMPYFTGLFFFIFGINALGLIPSAHTASGAIGVTGSLALVSLFMINFTAIRESGIGAWFHHLLGGAPWWLFPIMVPIEIVGIFVKPFALTIRLFANMTAGHVVLFSLLGILFYFNSIALFPAITGFSVFILFLESLVSFLQAYLFTLLTAIFVGLAIGSHPHGHHEVEHKHA